MGNRGPIFQPNELSNDVAASMRTRIIAGLTALAIILPFVMFGDWPFFAMISIVLGMAIVEIVRCAKTKYSKALYVVALILAFLILFWNFFQDIPSMFKADDSWSGIYDSYGRIYISITIMFIGICLLFLTILVDKNFTIVDATFIFTTVVLIALGLQSFLFIRYFPVHIRHEDLRALGETASRFNAYDNCESFLFVLYVALGACLNDAFAYFVGVFFGKHK